MTPTVSLRAALADKKLLGNAMGGDSMFGWRTLWISAMGEELISAGERAAYTKFTTRETSPTQRVNEVTLVCGRRSGKSRTLAVIAAYVGALCDWSANLIQGETGVLLVLAQDQKVARQILNYCEAVFDQSP